MRGRLAEAAKVLDAGVEAARLAGITQSLAWMLRNRSWLSMASGDVVRSARCWPRRRSRSRTSSTRAS